MILAVLQARYNSSRLPGKVMKPLLGRPMLERQVERILRACKVDKLIIATSTQEMDDPIEKLARSISVECFRGSLDDVLARFYFAAKIFQPEHVLRLTGDCPLSDPAIIDQLIDLHLAAKNDYTSNCIEPSFPDGLDAEIMTFSALEQAFQKATLPSEREHVTPYILKEAQGFSLGLLKSAVNLSHLRWTVDESKDFELVETIYKALYEKKITFSMMDILDWLDLHPEWKTYNTEYARNEGLKKSLQQDQEFILRKVK